MYMDKHIKMSKRDFIRKNLLDDQHPFFSIFGLDNKESWVLYNSIFINGQNARVFVSDPGHSICSHLPHPAREVDGLPHPNCDVGNGMWWEVWACVKPNKMLRGHIRWLEAADESWKKLIKHKILTKSKSWGQFGWKDKTSHLYIKGELRYIIQLILI